MITKVLLFESEHAAAEGLKKLEMSGISKEQLSVLVSNVEHSRLLHAESDIPIDMLSEIAAANRGDDRSAEGVSEGFVLPFFTPQSTVPVPVAGMPGIVQQDFNQEQGTASLLAYGLSQRNAEHCLNALRAGQCVVCINDYSEERDTGLYINLELAFSGSGSRSGNSDHPQEYFPSTGAIEVLNN